MCFSATASFTAAGVISVIGVFTLCKARTYPVYLFALIPLFFALQQALEGVVWLTLMDGDSSSLIHKTAVYGFLFFAGVFWPVWLPACVYLLEDREKLKKILFFILMVGVIVAGRNLLRLILQNHSASIAGNHIFYPMIGLSHSVNSFWYIFKLLFTLAYLIAVIAPFFVSSIKNMPYLGLIITASFIIADIFYKSGFGSVWCFFGALISIAAYPVILGYNKAHSEH